VKLQTIKIICSTTYHHTLCNYKHLVSPCFTVMKDRGSSFKRASSFSRRTGGSKIASSVSLNVPQCMPIERFALTARWIPTASSGEQWIALMKKRGEYAPMGKKAASKGPKRLPISAKLGHTGNSTGQTYNPNMSPLSAQMNCHTPQQKACKVTLKAGYQLKG
jgi:hypothetical protein